jgi:hypothetical protein
MQLSNYLIVKNLLANRKHEIKIWASLWLLIKIRSYFKWIVSLLEIVNKWHQANMDNFNPSPIIKFFLLPRSYNASMSNKPIIKRPFLHLKQACTTYGPRAKSGPRNPKILIPPLIKTPFECVKTFHLWPLDMFKNMFGQ